MEKVEHVITIINAQRKISITKEIKDLIKKTVKKVISYEEINFPCEVSVSIIDNKNIKELNCNFRNIDKATDVLSFPSGEYKVTSNIDALYSPLDETGLKIQIKGERLNPEGLCFLGDIAISAEKAEAQRLEFGHSLNREIAFLTAHSMLHLLGYDHVPPFNENIMFFKQEEILQQMGLSR
jgi:probable rRNA maturation factor